MPVFEKGRIRLLFVSAGEGLECWPFSQEAVEQNMLAISRMRSQRMIFSSEHTSYKVQLAGERTGGLSKRKRTGQSYPKPEPSGSRISESRNVRFDVSLSITPILRFPWQLSSPVCQELAVIAKRVPRRGLPEASLIRRPA